MSNINMRKFHKTVRETCEQSGWEVWFTYNDKRKDGSRRISYYRNGWRIPEDMKQKITELVQKIVNEVGMDGRVYWHEAERWGYGMYDKLCIEIAK